MRRRRVLHRLRLFFLLLFVFFWLRAVRDTCQRKTANYNNKCSHKMFPFSVVRLLEICTYSTLERSFSDAFGPQNAGSWPQSAALRRCCRTASNNTIPTAVARFRLRVPCIGIVTQLLTLVPSKSSERPFVSRPNTRKSSF